MKQNGVMEKFHLKDQNRNLDLQRNAEWHQTHPSGCVGSTKTALMFN